MTNIIINKLIKRNINLLILLMFFFYIVNKLVLNNPRDNPR